LAAEGALRWLRPTPCPSATTSEVMACLHTYSDVYGWELRKGIRLPIAGGWISVDDRGWRTVAGASEAARPVLVSLGDSVAFGLDVDDRATLASQLQGLLPALAIRDLSVPGYGTDQELIKLEREGLALRPAVVLLNFCLANDLVDNAEPTFLYDGVHPKPYFRIEGGALRRHDEQLRLGRAARAAVWLSEHSVLFNAVSPGRGARVLAAHAAGPDGPAHWETRYTAAMARPGPLLDLAVRLIEAMRDGARSAGGRLVVVSHPSRRSFADPASPLESALRARLEASGIPFVPLAPIYRARGLEFADLALDGVGHLGARGHRAAAEAIREVVLGATAEVRPSPSPPRSSE